MQNSSSLRFELASPLLFFYRWLNYFRREFVKGELSPIPSVSIGNLAFGGTGKTPVTIAVAEHFLRKGMRVGVATRGYGVKIKGIRTYTPREEIDPWEAGDEAAVLRENLKDAWIFAGKKREISAELAKAEGLDILILDDAFQYLSLRKIEVVLHSSKIPFFYLRESKAALKYADILLFPEGEEGERLPVSFSYRLFPENIPDSKVYLVCGIARPETFFSLFDPSKIEGMKTFPDHWRHKKEDLDNIYRMAAETLIVTTEKDFVKLKKLPNFRGGILPIKWKAKIQEFFFDILEKILEKVPLRTKIKEKGNEFNKFR